MVGMKPPLALAPTSTRILVQYEMASAAPFSPLSLNPSTIIWATTYLILACVKNAFSGK